MTCLSNIYSVNSFALNTVGDLAHYQWLQMSMGFTVIRCTLLIFSIQTESLSATELQFTGLLVSGSMEKGRKYLHGYTCLVVDYLAGI